MLGNSLAVLFALCAAIFAAFVIVVRQRATMDVPAEKGVSAVMLRTLLRRRLWWLGTASAVAGYAFQAVALAFGSLLLVQPVLVSALLFALPLSAYLAHRRVSRAEWVWALVLTTALAVFVVLARASTGTYHVSVLTTVSVAVVCAVAVGLCVLAATRSVHWRRAVLLAVAVGVMFGVVAGLTKIVMHTLAKGTLVETLASPALYLVCAVGVGGTLLQQSAFHAGSLQTSVPTMLVLEPVVAVVLGAIVLGEHMMITGWEPIALALAIGAMVAATVALGHDAGAYEESLEAEVTGRASTKLPS
mgnify:CR=1 FL=1